MNLEGKRLGKYELQAEIGRGAMGVVYRGFDPALKRPVAIKVLAPHLAWEQAFVKRFLREAQAAARLKHANIVTIHDVGEQDGTYYFVMEYLEGCPLSHVLRERGRLTSVEALGILRQLADALDYAHENGLVHRDVKPGNVMVDERGQVTLTDFGLVHAAQETRLTVTGAALGTPRYMSPEHAAGRPVGPSSDLYSLAVIAYELLCGEPPFDADSTPALLHMVVYDPPPRLTSRCPTLPRAVDGALNRALAKQPEGRYPAGAAFVEALAGALSGEVRVVEATPPEVPTFAERAQKPTRPAPRMAPPRRAPAVRLPRWAWITGGVVALGLILAGLRLGLQGQEEIAPTEIAAGGPSTTPEPTLRASATPQPARTRVHTPTSVPTWTAVARPTFTPPPTHTPTRSLPPIPAAGETWTRPTDGAAMVYVPAGKFQMGSTQGEDDQQPVHTVALNACWIDRTEVTNAQYQKCVAAGACQAPTRCDWGEPTYGDLSKSDHPVVCVDWNAAQAYCQWVGGRLPTEAEWEYAARGPQGLNYPWGNTFECSRSNLDDETLLSDYVVSGRKGCDGYERTAPVGSFAQGVSWCGALDMAGNVWEWVADWYGPYPAAAQSNPTGPENGDDKVLRGGLWLYDGDWVRSAYRNWDVAGIRNDLDGFRCVVSSTP